MTLFPSACLWTCRDDPKQVLQQVKETAFHFVDVTPDFAASADLTELAGKLGLKVGTAMLERDPGGWNDAASARQMSDRLKRALEQCVPLRPQAACIKPCASGNGLAAFGRAAAELAGEAAKHGIRLCVENHPRSALGSAREVLRLLDKLSHTNLHLLLDTGHTLISGEDAAQAVRDAGPRLGAIQFHDNNGRSDKHWALLEGRTSEQGLRRILAALKDTGYQGTLGLEVRWDRASVISGLSKNRNLLLRLQAEGEIKSLIEPEARRKH